MPPPHVASHVNHSTINAPVSVALNPGRADAHFADALAFNGGSNAFTSTVGALFADGSANGHHGLFGNTPSLIYDGNAIDAVPTAGMVTFTLPVGQPGDEWYDYSISGISLADGTALPPWLTFDPISNTFSAAPDAGFKGQLEILVIIEDADGNEQQLTMQVDVTGVGGAAGDPPRAKLMHSKPAFSAQLHHAKRSLSVIGTENPL